MNSRSSGSGCQHRPAVAVAGPAMKCAIATSRQNAADTNDAGWGADSRPAPVNPRYSAGAAIAARCSSACKKPIRDSR